MADRNGLKLVGYVFASLTVAVMLVAGMMVKSHADGAAPPAALPLAVGSLH